MNRRSPGIIIKPGKEKRIFYSISVQGSIEGILGLISKKMPTN